MNIDELNLLKQNGLKEFLELEKQIKQLENEKLKKEKDLEEYSKLEKQMKRQIRISKRMSELHIFEENIQKSKIKKDYIRKNFKEYTKEKVFEYFNSLEEELKLTSELNWDEDKNSFVFYNKLLMKTPFVINKDYGHRKVIKKVESLLKNFDSIKEDFHYNRYINYFALKRLLKEFEVVKENDYCHYFDLTYNGNIFRIEPVYKSDYFNPEASVELIKLNENLSNKLDFLNSFNISISKKTHDVKETIYHLANSVEQIESMLS